jgi:hypothetical protein
LVRVSFVQTARRGSNAGCLSFLIRSIALFALVPVAVLPAAASAQEARPEHAVTKPRFDTEHIFGFGEGSDFGPMGEYEIESFSVGMFGAAGSNFKVGNETSLRYSIIDGLRLSVGALTDYLNLHNLPSPGARNGLNVNGIITEVRWNIFNRLISPFGMTLSVNPEWRRTDPESGRYNDNFAVTTALLIDKEVIPDKFFMELNLVYSPFWRPVRGTWLRDDSYTVLVGGSYVITPDILVGAEIRHENLAPSGNPISHALFVGPHLFLQLGEDLTASFAWAFQIPDLGVRQLDLAKFERYEAGLRLVYSF